MYKYGEDFHVEDSLQTVDPRSLMMAPSVFQHVGIPTSTFLTPTTDNRGIPARKTQYQTPLQPSNGIHAPHSGNPRGPRLLTVDEALQFSPLSSIIPFSPDIVPLPNARLLGSQPIFPTQSEKSGAKQSLNVLDKDIGQSRGQSKLAQATLNDLRPYLDKNAITNFKFKVPTGLTAGRPGVQSSSGSTDHQERPAKLGPFANMFLNSTGLAHRYPTPNSPESVSPKRRDLAQPLQKASRVKKETPDKQQKLPVTPTTPEPHAHIKATTPQNVSASVKLEELPKSDAKLRPIVLIKFRPADSRPGDDITIPVEETEHPRKRKRDEIIIAIGTKDQRAVANEALHRLQEIIQDIFEADDQSQPDISGTISAEAGQFFVSAHYEEREINTLAPAIHVKLEAALQKVISLGKYDEIPIDHLCRLQSLCQGGLASAESSEIHAELNSGLEDDSKWIQGIEALDSGLRATRTILRIMTGGRQEKEIYSEELLQNVLRVVEKVLSSSIIPIVEARSTGTSSAVFETASSHRKIISQLLYDVKKAMTLLAGLLTKVEMAETIITTMEFFATRLLFVDNAHSEKESILGIQKFETLRRTAMDLIAEIFSRYPQQRAFLFDEILTSLQKLPVKGQQARQYKLADGTSIQLVSALIIRLVQTSATSSASRKEGKRRLALNGVEQGQSDDSEAEDLGSQSASQHIESSDEMSEDATDSTYDFAIQRLADKATLLNNSAAQNAQYVIRFYVSRGMTAPKTGDQPHRQLLDMFAEDLIAVLGLPEWPAAELLLRALLIRMVDISESKQYNAPAKTMALELLGLMGSAISELVASTRNSARILENHDSERSGYLRQLLDDYMEGKLEANELLGWEGPYHVVMQYLQPGGSEDKQTTSARGYYLTQWAKAVSSGNLTCDTITEKLANRLRKMLSRAEWDALESETEPVSSNQIRLAYALTILSMDFCRQFDRILKILLDSISSESTTVRNRSLKSVMQMLEKDPSLLDRARNVKVKIMNCTTDNSSMVRDSALMLIGKCILLQPMLEQEFCKTVLVLTNDPAIGVRKRSMRLLKDIYLRNNRKDIKAAIADCLLQRTKDLDAGVSDLARQTFEDIWFSPFWKLVESAEQSAQEKISLQSQVSLIVGTVQRGEGVALAMVSLIQNVLLNVSKMAAANFKVCKALVATAFEIMIDSQDLPERLEQRHILQTLTVFARANPRLFAADQLQYLQPYITNLSSSDDLNLFRSVVVIFRCVLPILSTIQHGLLREVQTALLHSISKLGKAELDEVAACLWTINGTLNNPEKLVKLTVSVLKNLRNSEGVNFADPKKSEGLKMVKKYIRIAGYFGKHCDFEIFNKNFQDSLSWWKGSSVAGLIVCSLSPFAKANQPLTLRCDALEGIGLICQSWPYQFNQDNISRTFEDVLEEGSPELQKIVLSSFRDFFSKQERQAGVKSDELLGEENLPANGKLGGSMTASDGDGASALIAQRFLKSILRIALASQDLSALTATQVITSINRQGLVHPKESGPALVALETSTNQDIADVAFQEHRNLHQQHESMFEREYMRAIQEAFKYQRDIVNDPLGTTKQPLGPKLHGMFEIIKTSKGKYQKKFLSNFCSKIDFEIAKLDTPDAINSTLQYSRFLIENLAFFDYGRLDELLHTISCMEKIVASTGSGIAHSISTEVFQIKVENLAEKLESNVPGAVATAGAVNTDVDPRRLRQLTTGAIILSCLWEARTHLRRLFGLQATQQRRENKAKATVKDLNKAPTRVHGVSGERLLTVVAEKINSLESHEATLKQCQDFVELLSIDSEVKVADDGDDEAGAAETPSADEEDAALSSIGGAKPLKRKAPVSASGTPHRKKKARPSAGKRKRCGKGVSEEEDWG